jgi:hypothetical protein
MFSANAAEKLGPTFPEHSGHALARLFTPLVHKLQLFSDDDGNSSPLHFMQLTFTDVINNMTLPKHFVSCTRK